MPGPAPKNSATTNRVRQHRATAGLIRVEVEVPSREDALAIRRSGVIVGSPRATDDEDAPMTLAVFTWMRGRWSRSAGRHGFRLDRCLQGRKPLGRM